jgi:hypothetical protein
MHVVRAGSSIFVSCVKVINAVSESVLIFLKASFGHLFIILMPENLCLPAKYPLGSITIISKFKFLI